LQTIRTANPPEDLKDHYTADHLTKTRAYSVDKKTYALVHGLFGAAESFAVLWFQLLPQLWTFSADLTARMKPSWAQNEILVTITFVLFTSVLSMIQELPWSLFYTFVLEEKHGFNKQTLSLFAVDTLKSVRPHSLICISRAGELYRKVF
jgi:STE24 endopeptidase